MGKSYQAGLAMSVADLPEALLKTILHQIAILLLDGAGGNMEAAWSAAASTLRACEALAQAADPAMPLTRILRLRTGAVSLSREAEKAERRLEKLREARLRGLPEEPESFPES